MKNYKEIVNLLNSSDPEIILLGLNYLKETEISFSTFQEDYNLVIGILSEFPEASWRWSRSLNYLIWKIRNYYHDLIDFSEYQDKDSIGNYELVDYESIYSKGSN